MNNPALRRAPWPARPRYDKPGHGPGISASPRHALSLIEVVAATMIVGIMAVAALNSLGAATRSAESTGNRAVAQGLADALMTEILATAYSGLDTYHDRDEQLTGNRADWRRQVVVETVNADNPIQTVGADQRAKRIRVTVEYDGHILADQIAVKTNHD